MKSDHLEISKKAIAELKAEMKRQFRLLQCLYLGIHACLILLLLFQPQLAPGQRSGVVITTQLFLIAISLPGVLKIVKMRHEVNRLEAEPEKEKS